MPNQYSITLSDVSAHYLQDLNRKHGWKTSHIIDVALQLSMFNNISMLTNDNAQNRLLELLNTKRVDK
tara:strand:+ start:830 stop:1033 length:204 start_codon:yes stop_codon:yes gene_type:complete